MPMSSPRITKAKKKCARACMRQTKALIRMVSLIKQELELHVATLRKLPHPDDDLYDLQRSHQDTYQGAKMSILVANDYITDMFSTAITVDDDATTESGYDGDTE
ncbi:hypothetical protein LTR37_014082 [Vermiconidia calcicola]|uniref:Uncharacterized protein n=1 Tax=Vermiconidia calcicola TaxID=1690605 RepID=A0ACC3MXC1_9PEZI|nr:hypothetical protein LTR37_014082 [Vermiconidia calcicola]